MTNAEILTGLKTDLQIAVNSMDGYLTNLIARATAEFVREGMTVQDTVEDGMLVEAYAAFLFRHRRENGVKMPDSIRWQLNNRILSEKAGTTESPEEPSTNGD